MREVVFDGAGDFRRDGGPDGEVGALGMVAVLVSGVTKVESVAILVGVHNLTLDDLGDVLADLFQVSGLLALDTILSFEAEINTNLSEISSKGSKYSLSTFHVKNFSRETR